MTPTIEMLPLLALLAVAGVSMARSVALLVRAITRELGSPRERTNY